MKILNEVREEKTGETRYLQCVLMTGELRVVKTSGKYSYGGAASVSRRLIINRRKIQKKNPV